MPFMMTEPQRIEGTKLGYSVYPYHFSFQDHTRQKDCNQKLVVFELKDSKFVEVEKKLIEIQFADYLVSRDFVAQNLKKFVVEHPCFVTNPQRVVEFFKNKTAIDDKEVKIL